MRHRHDPRRERDARRLPGAGRPRFSRAAGVTGLAQQRGQRDENPAQTPPRIVDSPAFLVLALTGPDAGPDTPETRAVIAAARKISDGRGGAVCLLGVPGEDDPGLTGADRVIRAKPGHVTAAGLASLARSLGIPHLVFPETPHGGDLARRVAARLGSRFLGGVEHIADGRAHRPARGGRSELVAPLSQVLSVSVPHFDVPAPQPGEARLLEAALITERDAAPGLVWRRLPVRPGDIALAEADFILGGGDGITDWEAFAELGGHIGAVLGGSRVVCDAGHLPRDRQIGASGTVVAARCYVALGISGAPQHLQGVADVPHIVAVNTDLHAQMVRRADLSVIADAQEVMPALIRLLCEDEPGT